MLTPAPSVVGWPRTLRATSRMLAVAAVRGSGWPSFSPRVGLRKMGTCCFFPRCHRRRGEIGTGCFFVRANRCRRRIDEKVASPYFRARAARILAMRRSRVSGFFASSTDETCSRRSDGRSASHAADARARFSARARSSGRRPRAAARRRARWSRSRARGGHAPRRASPCARRDERCRYTSWASCDTPRR